MRVTASIILGLLLGAVPTALLWGRARGVDLRRAGSGNPGAANAYRVLGARAGLGVLAADLAKGALAVVAARALGAGEAAEVAAGTASVAAHVAGPFAAGRGGKGMATGCGAFLVLAPEATLGCLGSWAVLFALTRIPSLASIAAAVLLPPLVFVSRGDSSNDLVFWAASGVAVLVLFRHRSNIARLLAGREPRLAVHARGRAEGHDAGTSRRPGADSR